MPSKPKSDPTTPTTAREPAAERLMPIAEVVRRVGLSKSTCYLWAQQGRFPKPILVGPRTARWRESQIDVWVKGRGDAGLQRA